MDSIIILFPLLIHMNVPSNSPSIMNTGKCWIEISAVGWLWNHWSSVSHKKLMEREHCVCRSVVMVKKPDIFPPKFCHLSCTANRFQKTKCNFMQICPINIYKNHQCMLSLNQIIVSTWHDNRAH